MISSPFSCTLVCAFMLKVSLFGGAPSAGPCRTTGISGFNAEETGGVGAYFARLWNGGELKRDQYLRDR